MPADIGVGLALNILFWTAAIVVAVALASLAVVAHFPGKERRVRKGNGKSRAAAPTGADRPRADESREGYRRAS